MRALGYGGKSLRTEKNHAIPNEEFGMPNLFHQSDRIHFDQTIFCAKKLVFQSTVVALFTFSSSTMRTFPFYHFLYEIRALFCGPLVVSFDIFHVRFPVKRSAYENFLCGLRTSNRLNFQDFLGIYNFDILFMLMTQLLVQLAVQVLNLLLSVLLCQLLSLLLSLLLNLLLSFFSA